MKLKLSFPKFRLKLEDTEEKKELRGTEGRYTLKEKAAPLAQQENDAEFRDFPDFDFTHIAGKTSIIILWQETQRVQQAIPGAIVRLKITKTTKEVGP